MRPFVPSAIQRVDGQFALTRAGRASRIQDAREALGEQ
jgi:hypothetical protein